MADKERFIDSLEEKYYAVTHRYENLTPKESQENETIEKAQARIKPYDDAIHTPEDKRTPEQAGLATEFIKAMKAVFPTQAQKDLLQAYKDAQKPLIKPQSEEDTEEGAGEQAGEAGGPGTEQNINAGMAGTAKTIQRLSQWQTAKWTRRNLLRTAGTSRIRGRCTGLAISGRIIKGRVHGGDLRPRSSVRASGQHL